MKKHKAKTTPIDDLNERLQKLLDRRLKAYNAGMSTTILEQIENLIAETQLDLYTETELENSRKADDDGEQWIV